MWMLLLACAPDPTALPVDLAAPPAMALSLSAGALVPGAPFSLIVDGANPGERVQLARSPAGIGAGPCLAAAGGACLNLGNPVSRLGSAIADGAGQARLTLNIPAFPLGREMGFQAVVLRGPGGASSQLSNPLLRTTGTAAAPLSALAPGELVITELMTQASDWIEVYNAHGGPIDLQGLHVTLGDGTDYLIDRPVIVDAGAYAVLGGERDAALNGGVWFDTALPGLDLQAVDSVSLSYGGAVLDEVSWDATWPDAPGAAMSLSDDLRDVTLNDTGWRWCDAVTPYGAGDLGTPGAANPLCPVAPPNVPPVASALCTSPADATSYGLVDGLGSYDSDGSIVDVRVDYGDGDEVSAVAPALWQHVYYAEGSYDVTVTVTDDRGGTDSARCTMDVAPALASVTLTSTVSFTNLYNTRTFEFPPGPPARAGGPLTWTWLAAVCPAYGGPAYTQIWLNTASGLHQAGYDSTMQSCVNETGSGSAGAEDINSARDAAGVIHASAYGSSGCHPGIGCTYYSDPILNTVVLRYAADAPSARLSCPRTATVGVPVVIDASASTTPFGSLVRWAIGDRGVLIGPDTQPTFTHTFTTPGTHQLWATVTDSSGLTMSDVCHVEVAP